ncbi:substrate-binding domain-containing protein [Burkholderia aenigmatica]|uniref:substrate-binding domain-containing protein n=1 Tax=Burkholderia aenigmatica TaxID=2015348 RepID=UPI003B4282A1
MPWPTRSSRRAVTTTAGVVTINDLLAPGLMAGRRKIGRRVPEDMSAVGTEGSFWVTISNPPHTTIQPPIPRIVGEIVRSAIRTRDSTNDAARSIFTNISLVECESVGPEGSRPCYL